MGACAGVAMEATDLVADAGAQAVWVAAAVWHALRPEVLVLQEPASAYQGLQDVSPLKGANVQHQLSAACIFS